MRQIPLLGLAALLFFGAVAPCGAAEPPLPHPTPAAAPAAAAVDPPVDLVVDPVREADLFAMPRLTQASRAALEMAQAGDLAAATALLDPLLAAHPGVGLLLANRAVLAMLAGDASAARAGLMAAAAADFPDLAIYLADPLFAPLAADPELAAMAAAPAAAAAAPAPVPAPVAGGTALVSGANTAWDPAAERLEPRFAFPDKPAGKVLPPLPKVAAWNILREHAKRGRAAGNHGDLYDNRDRGHSRLDPAAHPQVTAVRYSPAARAADLDYGLNDSLLFDRVTFGNSSTALTGGPFWRSLPRYAMTRPDGTGPLRLWQNASANQLYVYPAHKDYDDRKDGIGDLFPANTPYVIVTRGSSGSDQPFLDAVAMILAAFRPDTKARLTEEKLIVPTVQMVFRRSLQNVLSRDDYFSANAHPAAFERFNLNLARMVSLANSIQPGDIPPQVRIRMVEEDLGTEGTDYFGEGLSEQLFDTPAAIARIWRSRAYTRAMTVSAEETADPNNRPLSFAWRLLQGDPSRVRITPSDDGRTARIEMDWHEPFPISKDNPVRSARVDIGVFANNGVHDSAPAIISMDFPTHETRSYVPGPNGGPRIAAIDHADPAKAKTYADPMLMAWADWRDDYAYAPDGTPLGWIRTRGALTEDFTADGARIVTRAPDGSPLALEQVTYPLRRDAEGRLTVEEIAAALP